MTKPGTYKRIPNLPEGYVFGRPTIYRKEYCQQLIEHMAQGLSFKSFAGRIPCGEATIARWVEEHPDFRDAKIIGRALERMIWEQIHLNCAHTGKGNMTGIIWAQKNKWPEDYKEKNETVLTQDLSITGDFKSLVASMTPEQLYGLIKAAEDHVNLIEASSEKKDDK